MKNSLANNVLVVCIFLITALCYCRRSFASQDIFYYASFFGSLGFDTVSPNFIQEVEGVDYINNRAFTRIISDRYSLFIASQKFDTFITSHRTVIFICDVDFRYIESGTARSFTCSSSTAQGSDIREYNLALESDTSSIYVTHMDDHEIVIIPMNVIMQPESNSRLRDYFSARYMYESARAVESATGFEKVYQERIATVPVYASSVNFLTMFVVVLLLSSVAKTLLTDLVVVSGSLASYVVKYKNLLFLVLFMTLGAFIPYCIFIISRVTSSILVDLPYIFNPNYMISEYKLEDFNLFLYIYLLIISSAVLILLAIPSLQSFFSKKLNFRFSNTTFVARLVYICLLGLSILPLILPSTDMYVFVLVSCVMFLVLTRLIKSSASAAQLPHAALFVPIIFFCLAVIFLNKHVISHQIVELYPRQSSFVLLPQIVPIKDVTQFVSDFVTPSFPVFINGIGVFYPGVSRITTLPIDKFDPATNYIVLSPSNADDYVQALYYSHSLRTKLLTPTPTTLINLPPSQPTDKYTLVLDFNCATDLPSINIAMQLYFDDSLLGGFVSNYPNISLANFPGCNASEQDSIVTHNVAMAIPPELLSKHLIVRLNNTSQLSNLKLRMLKNGKTIGTNYFLQDSFESKHVLLSSVSKNSSEINIYSSYVLENYTVDDIGAEINLADSLNELIRRNLIKDRAEIWAPDDGVILIHPDLVE